MTNKRKALEGLRVVDLSTYVAAPTCGKLLADQGAEVIKVETPKGDPRRIIDSENGHNSVHFDIHNSGKKSIVLDLKTEAGLEVMHKLLENADVFVTNVRFAGLRRLGLDHQTLRQRYPRLVYGIVTAYGEKGPKAPLPGFDSSAFWAASGALRDNLPKEADYPAYPPSSTGDTVTGLSLYSGILTALINRSFTGEGDYIEVSLYNAGIWMYAIPIVDVQVTKKNWPLSIYEQRFQWGFYKCKDGEWFQLCLMDYMKERERLFTCVGLPELIGDPRVETMKSNGEHNEELRKMFEEAFLKYTADEWVEKFHEADLVGARMAHHIDITTDEQAWANDYLQKFEYPNGGSVVYVKPPMIMESQGGAPVYRFGPNKGEHTEEILKGLGYSDEQIAAMESAGSVFRGEPHAQLPEKK